MSEVQTFRPSASERRRIDRAGAAVVGVWVALGLIAALVSRSFAGLLICVPFEVVTVPIIGGLVLYLHRARIVIGPDAVVSRGALLSRRTERADLGRLVRADVRQYSGGVGGIGTAYLPRLVLLRRDGSRAALITQQFWGASALSDVRTALDLPVEDLGEISLRRLRRTHKGAIHWVAAHQVSAVLLAVAGLFVLCFVVLAAVSLGTTIF